VSVAVAFNINIMTGSDTPIYRQITEQIRMGVATGKLKIADPLPSVRGLAEELVVNPNTVARAYSDLAREGVIESRPGKGVTVIRKRKVFTRQEGWRRLEPMIDSLIGEAMAMDFSQEELREALEKKLLQWKDGGANNRKDDYE
jgi:GntR family transcriptional regulator